MKRVLIVAGTLAVASTVAASSLQASAQAAPTSSSKPAQIEAASSSSQEPHAILSAAKWAVWAAKEAAKTREVRAELGRVARDASVAGPFKDHAGTSVLPETVFDE
jgi:hypothetical protein